jgi:hypothetical protein
MPFEHVATNDPSEQQPALAEAEPLRLLVCVGPRCDAEGRGRALLEAARAALGASRVIVSSRDCLRLCTRDPVVRIEPSGEAISNPTLDDLLRLIEDALPHAAERSTRNGS